MTNEEAWKKADLAFAAEHGDGSVLWAELTKLAEAIGYRVELEEPAEPITYDTRVEFHLLPGCPQLLPFDPYYGDRIFQAIARARHLSHRSS
jgi:hypothetical protein